MTLRHPKQVKAARLFLDWEQRELAERADVSLPTIQRTEKLGMERSQAGNVRKVQRASEVGGIEFVAENGVGVRLKGRRL